MNREKETSGYSLFSSGDINAFFGLLLDNILNLVLLAGFLIGGFGFPADIIYQKMIPGTAFGVFVGDLIYTIMAKRLAKKTGRRDVCAMPLGLDTPSTMGVVFVVLGPTYLETKDAILTWQVGMATIILMGIVKLAASFFGDFIRKSIPRAGLLGSIGGIGLCLLAYLPLLKIFSLPVVGFISLGLILFTLVAKIRLPKNFPGAFAAVFAGTAVYYILGPLNLTGGEFRAPTPELYFAMPIPTLSFLNGMERALHFLPVAIPFGILTIIGGINVTESARAAGDQYKTRDILLTEAFATIIAGFCGGVAQSTPYIGHPAYKEMGGRAGYTLLTALFIGFGGVFGYISFIIGIIPEAAVMPILVFIGIEITVQAFQESPREHAPAVAFAFLPIISYLLFIELAPFMGEAAAKGFSFSVEQTTLFNVTKIFSGGFIITAMLWGAFAAALIDRNRFSAMTFLLVSALLTLFGFIHSVSPDGGIYLPWNAASSAHYFIAASYLLMGTATLFLKKKNDNLS